MRKPKVISLFAGIGGFDLAFERAGFEIVAHVEKDKACRKLLAEKFPNAKTFEDVREVGAHNLPACDVVVGGWPCQDLSVAGKRAGLAGERSGLFYEFIRIVAELRPRYLVAENVPGLLSSDEGRDFARVLGTMGDIGARDIGWRVLDAQYFGLAQRRERVFIVADFGGERCDEILSLTEGLRGHPAPRREAGQDVAGTLTGGVAGGSGHGKKSGTDREGFLVAATLNSGGNNGGFRTEPGNHLVAGAVTCKWAKGSGGPSGNECQNLTVFNHQSGKAQSTYAAVRRLTVTECEFLQGFPRGWTRGDQWDSGFSASARYRMLGNAVAVPVVQWIATNLIEHGDFV